MKDFDEKSFSERFIAALGPWAPEQAGLLARHAWLVRRKNEQMNLTRITDPEDMAIRHALDALAAVPILQGSDEMSVNRILDLGTGAGWPGLALAVALPHLKVTLLDSTRKKIDFLKEVVTDLGVGDRVKCVWARFEDYIGRRRHEYDMVLARAVGPLPRLLEWSTGCWFGHSILWKGPGFDEELNEARDLMVKRKIMVLLDQPYNLPGDDTERRLVVLGSI